jgi:hypothetical protein
MEDFIANPNKNLIYTLELPRLSSRIQYQLAALKRRPTKERLNVFHTCLDLILEKSMLRVADSAYRQGAEIVGFPVDPSKALQLRRNIIGRSKQAGIWITDVTGEALDIRASMTRERVASKGRADLIGINNLAVAFFRGTRFGWGLDKRSRKRWHISDAHDQDDICDSNVEDGALEIDEPFTSGDFEPPAHVECNCWLKLTRSPWPQ